MRSNGDSKSASTGALRRARHVCIRCHEKKIKCNLLANGGISQTCTHCRDAERECQLRISKRRGVPKASSRVRRPSTEDVDLPITSLIDMRRTHVLPTAPQERANTNTSFGAAGDGLVNYTVSDELDAASSVPPEDDLDDEASDSVTAVHAPLARDETGYLGRSGLLSIFSDGHGGGLPMRHPRQDATSRSSVLGTTPPYMLPPPKLQTTFAETYLEYCYTWCPILDRETLLNDPVYRHSALLQQCLALLGSRMNPPLIKHETPDHYYRNAKRLLYGNKEPNARVRVVSVMLMYWWSAGPPNVVSMDSQFWWTGLAVKLAQQLGLHRDPSRDHLLQSVEAPGLRRRIWWTLFARERLTSICQGRPCSIDPEDCNVREPTLEDFPPQEAARGEIFIHWVRLCDIIGRAAKFLNFRTEWQPIPDGLTDSLIGWVNSLPRRLRFPFNVDAGLAFDRDKHQLHLPYLTTVTLLYMSNNVHNSTPSRPRLSLPRAYTAGILAASCVARIFEEYLARGSLKFLQGQAGWSISIAILALLRAREVDILRQSADESLEVLFLALREMAKQWHSSKMFLIGFEKLIGRNHPFAQVGLDRPAAAAAAHASTSTAFANDTDTPLADGVPGMSQLTELATWDSVNYLDYFPEATVDTNEIFRILLTNDPPDLFANFAFPNDLNAQVHDLFDDTLFDHEF